MKLLVLTLLVCAAISGCTLQTAGVATNIDPSTRPLALVHSLPPSALKRQLSACAAGPFQRSRFSISHRGAPRGYAEHTREGYLAAVRMGAGAIECDVTFTADNQLVCRHSQCDLHSTTNILSTPLADKCSEPFRPADGSQPATARCCTSDLTLQEFKSLCGRQDLVNPAARNVDEYLQPAPAQASFLAPPQQCGTLLSHAQSIELLKPLGVQFIPELKAPMVPMPHNNMTQQQYADALVNEYQQQHVAASRVHIQSFNPQDILYLGQQHAAFARGAIWLDARGRDPQFVPTLADMQRLKQAGIHTVAPPMPMLLQVDSEGQLQASDYALLARQAGLDIITWTFEAGLPTDPHNWLYANVRNYIKHDSQMLEVLDALYLKAGIKGIFSDWPGTVTYYANCLGLE